MVSDVGLVLLVCIELFKSYKFTITNRKNSENKYLANVRKKNSQYKYLAYINLNL